MHTLAISEQGTAVHAEGDTLTVYRGKNQLRRVRVAELDQLLLFGRVELSSGAVALLVRRGVDVAWLTSNGLFRARLLGRYTKHVALRLTQYRRAVDPVFCTRLAGTLIGAKVRQQRQVLLRAQRRLQDQDLAEALGRLRLLLDRVSTCTSLDSLRGLEGAAAATYFGQFNKLIRNDRFQFAGRNRRPPRDEVNAMLSFGYAVLGSVIETELYRCGLDPLLGFFHQPAYGRASLMLDLLEEFRPTVDSLVLRVVNRRQLTPQDFDRRTGQELSELLNPDDSGPPFDASPPAPSPTEQTPTEPTQPAPGGVELLAPWEEGPNDVDARVEPASPPPEDSPDRVGTEQSGSAPVVGVYLGDIGRKVFLSEFYRRLRERLYYPPRNASFELRDILREQIYQLARVLEADDVQYQPFLPE